MAPKRKLSSELKVQAYDHPSGGWGSVRSLATSLTRDHVPFRGPRVLMKQNKPDGFMCVSCAWAKPDPRVFEFCENGAQGDDLGDHPQACHARVLCRAYHERTGRLGRPSS
jgi:hypothetical protein